MKRSGTADLPLHGGRVPKWLSERMAALGKEIVATIVSEYGRSELLTRISDPFWFQALGCVMGMDWHSSGITTSVMGALKRGLKPLDRELGIYFCGGRGKQSLKTPGELLDISMQLSLNGDELVRASKLSAKVDNTCVQDGFNLYLHSFILTEDGEWAVIQQGMNEATKMARRYHWHSPSVRSFVRDPQAAIVGRHQGAIINMSDARAEPAHEAILDFLSRPPEQQLKEMRHLTMPNHHEVRPIDVNSKRLGAVLAAAYDQQFKDFSEALLLKGVGLRTVQALALVSEVIYGKPNRFDDPARFAFAHGGKDGHPFPVPLKVYDQSISILKDAVDKAKIGHTDKVKGLKRLTKLSRYIENNLSPEAEVLELINQERLESHLNGGMTVKGAAKPPKKQGPWQPELL